MVYGLLSIVLREAVCVFEPAVLRGVMVYFLILQTSGGPICPTSVVEGKKDSRRDSTGSAMEEDYEYSA